jgi:hypothetical protein
MEVLFFSNYGNDPRGGITVGGKIPRLSVKMRFSIISLLTGNGVLIVIRDMIAGRVGVESRRWGISIG